MVIGESEDGNFIASDVPAILKYTRQVYFVENEELVSISRGNIRFFNIDREPIEKEVRTIEWDIDAAEKGGYEYFMSLPVRKQSP